VETQRAQAQAAFEAMYSDAHRQHVVLCPALDIVVVPTVSRASDGVAYGADVTATHRAVELRDALNRIYGVSQER
jgi:hypothetical protein